MKERINRDGQDEQDKEKVKGQRVKGKEAVPRAFVFIFAFYLFTFAFLLSCLSCPSLLIPAFHSYD
jgi:hypothetical protein